MDADSQRTTCVTWAAPAQGQRMFEFVFERTPLDSWMMCCRRWFRSSVPDPVTDNWMASRLIHWRRCRLRRRLPLTFAAAASVIVIVTVVSGVIVDAAAVAGTTTAGDDGERRVRHRLELIDCCDQAMLQLLLPPSRGP